MNKILGISAYFHDAAAALIIDGEIVAAAQEERFTRQKNTPDFPSNAIGFCLQKSNLKIQDLDAIVFYDKPFLKFERLLQTYYAFAPIGLSSFIHAMPKWVNEKLFLKSTIKKELKKIEPFDDQKVKLLFSEHHLSHAASAFYPSGFTDAAILTIDGVGEWCTASLAHGKKSKIQLLEEMEFPHSVGLLYSAFTYYLGFTVNSGEYKVMGLAPYGNKDAEETLHFVTKIKEKLVQIYDDGSIQLQLDYFNFPVGLTMTNNKKWKQLFGIARRAAESELNQSHCNMALAIQIVIEEIIYKMAVHAKISTGSNYLCLAGGVALNCSATGKLKEAQLFKDIFVQPASGDAGGALGAALAVYYAYHQNASIERSKLTQVYLGPSFQSDAIHHLNMRFNAVAKQVESFEALSTFIAEKIQEGKVIGWFQGAMEFGPRALGNRSIIANPLLPDMQQKVNHKIKFREGFRPFAPAIAYDAVDRYFNVAWDEPFMTFVHSIKKELQFPLPNQFQSLSLKEKREVPRATLASVVHMDYTARIQTVHPNQNPKFYHLLKSFEKLSGHPVLINTSFNVRGEPIVCSPEDAYRCFMHTEMDILVLENFVYLKEEQGPWMSSDQYTPKFTD